MINDHMIVNVGDRVSVYVDLDVKCQRGNFRPIDGRRLFIGHGRALVSRHEVFQKTQHEFFGVGVLMTEAIFRTPSFSNILPTEIYLQNFPSYLVTRVLNVSASGSGSGYCSVSEGGCLVGLLTLYATVATTGGTCARHVRRSWRYVHSETG